MTSGSFPTADNNSAPQLPVVASSLENLSWRDAPLRDQPPVLDPSSTPTSWLGRCQQGLQKHLVGTISASVLLSLALTGTSTWNIWGIYRGLQTTVAKQFEIQDLSSDIIYLDEVLTMSARMGASTGDTRWEDRYNDYVPQLDAAIETLLAEIPISEQLNPEQTNAANQLLVDYETQAFEKVRNGRANEALQLLLGPDYEQQKAIYSEGIQGTLETLRTNVDNQLSSYRQRLAWSVTFAVGSLVLLALTWYIVLVAVRRYIEDRRKAQTSLEATQTNLLALTQQLTQEVQQRATQEESIRTESELLQTDVAHILDVVTSLEEGNLTIEAEVTERATGLVSDTLNRLIESLNRIVSVVISTAQQVTDNAEQLEGLAVETADRAQAQTRSVNAVRSLMETVNTLTAHSREQALATDEAVQQATTAIQEGQQEMTAMGEGITTLEQGTDQMVKRTQLLNDFVGLAAQFSKDQKRVASLTRVLALNASMLASRALKEQDPEQFTSIAHEFEAVARQVNGLAAETNQSLMQLQQRTDQIQTVTSGLNQDVSDLSQLVQKFTGEVGKSRQAFNNIQSVTGRLAQVGQQVSHSSNDIVAVVQQTLGATQEIAQLAADTDTKASITQQQAEAMGSLARTLLEMVEFFHVNSSAPSPSDNSSQPALAVAP
ncbi:methyl-accepting chemotaxis protein [Synechococcales cyanobacterium C]|uniref:Methyl-accepting chemotaxis protein n=1 Tax=Petrachloros mirabilis ULC683 TaxID=2781853 RepID=A0A8K2A7Q6_9CYAN|nr:methyl-accepting chemotaxis protein [Petrachloros mirabilis]NCJ06200.1 methyl-accepting chemotaxis protein [Petrachloros mirabilis ULC683]